MNPILPAQVSISWKSLLRWSLSFAGFPLAGVAARAAAGNIDDVSSAVVGGLTGGALLGAAQALAMPGLSERRRIAWAAATAVGMSGGLALGAGAVDFATDTQSLVAMGALGGAVVGLAQAAVSDTSPPRRIAWAALTPALWALGWLITSQVIVDADRQHAVFGSSGAITVTVLSGLILIARRAPDRHPANLTSLENAGAQS